MDKEDCPMRQPTNVKTVPKPGKFILRPYRRVPTWFMSYYLSGDAVGKGVVTNLSRTGMRVLGDHALSAGTEVSVRLALDDDSPSIEIGRATVRWVNEYDFGLQIDSISHDAARRIARMVRNEIQTGRCS